MNNNPKIEQWMVESEAEYFRINHSLKETIAKHYAAQRITALSAQVAELERENAALAADRDKWLIMAGDLADLLRSTHEIITPSSYAKEKLSQYDASTTYQLQHLRNLAGEKSARH